MKDIIVVLGPTASGKSALALDIAKHIDCELISADSMQIYKKMDIGTAKPEKHELMQVKHHMIDVVYPNETFSVSSFQKDSFNIVKNLHDNGKTPVFVGGTGLYVNSVLYDLDFTETPANNEFRDKMNKLKVEYGLLYLHNMLEQKDKESALRIHPNDEKRIIRRLEIIENQGEKSEYNFLKERTDYNYKVIGLACDRSILYDRINKRVDIMVEKGLFSEVESLYSEYGDGHNSLKAIGYKEIIGYIKGEYDKDEAIRLVKRNSRRFAKRQTTWFKREKRIIWYDICENDCLKDIINGII